MARKANLIKVIEKKKNDSAYANYLGDIISSQEANISIEAPFGIGIIKKLETENVQ